MFNIGVCHEDMTGKRGGENFAGMNRNAAGMSMHPFQWNLSFGRKIPSLLDF